MIGKIKVPFIFSSGNSFVPDETLKAGLEVRFDPFTLGKGKNVLVHWSKGSGHCMEEFSKSDVEAVEPEGYYEEEMLKELEAELKNHKKVLFVNAKVPNVTGYFFEDEDAVDIDHNRAVFSKLVEQMALKTAINVFYLESIAGKLALISSSTEIIALETNAETILEKFKGKDS